MASSRKSWQGQGWYAMAWKRYANLVGDGLSDVRALSDNSWSGYGRVLAACFRAMELTTILNRCHRFEGFIYKHARFSPDKKSIEVAVRPRFARDATSPRPRFLLTNSSPGVRASIPLGSLEIIRLFRGQTSELGVALKIRHNTQLALSRSLSLARPEPL